MNAVRKAAEKQQACKRFNEALRAVSMDCGNLPANVCMFSQIAISEDALVAMEQSVARLREEFNAAQEIKG